MVFTGFEYADYYDSDLRGGGLDGPILRFVVAFFILRISRKLSRVGL